MKETLRALHAAEVLVFYEARNGSTEDFIRSLSDCLDVAEAQLPQRKFPRDMEQELRRSITEELRLCRDEVDQLHSWFLLEEE